MEAIESFEHAGCKVEIHYDMDPTHPRKDWDNATSFVINGGRNFTATYELDPVFRTENFTSWADMAKAIIRKYGKKTLILGVRAYVHSGIALKAFGENDAISYPFDCQWDSGAVGLVVMTPAQFKECYGRRTAKNVAAAYELMRGDVQTYSEYLNGEVYGYTVESLAYPGMEDSCWGFFGVDYCKGEAREAAEGIQRQIERDLLGTEAAA